MLGITEGLNGILFFLPESGTTLGFQLHHLNGAFSQCLPDSWQVVGNWTASFTSGVNPVRAGFKSAVTTHCAKGALFDSQQVGSLWLMHPLLGEVHL